MHYAVDPKLCDTYPIITLVAIETAFRSVVMCSWRCNPSSIEAVAILLLSTWLERRRQTMLTRRKIHA